MRVGLPHVSYPPFELHIDGVSEHRRLYVLARYIQTKDREQLERELPPQSERDFFDVSSDVDAKLTEHVRECDECRRKWEDDGTFMADTDQSDAFNIARFRDMILQNNYCVSLAEYFPPTPIVDVDHSEEVVRAEITCRGLSSKGEDYVFLMDYVDREGYWTTMCRGKGALYETLKEFVPKQTI